MDNFLGLGNLRKLVGHPNFYEDDQGFITWRKTIKGKSFKLTTKTKKITEARKLADDFILSLTVQDTKSNDRAKRGILNPQIVHLWQECLSARKSGRSATTHKRWQTVWVNDLAPFWGDRHLSDFTQNAVGEYQEWFKKNRSNNSFFSASKYLKMLINFCHQKNYIKEKFKVENLDAIMPAIKKRKKPFRLYTENEKLALLECAVNLRTRVALTLFFDTGARKMEVLKLEIDNVNFNKGFVEFYSDKNKAWRKVPLTKRAAAALRELVDQNDGGLFLFAMKRDSERHMASQVFDEDWKETKRRAGIKGRARIHDARHTFASKTATDRWPVKQACEILDMSPKVYLGTYVHTSWENIVEDFRKSFDSGGQNV